MGRGTAYAARDFPYLLNVPAARLSADSADALQFLRFAQRRLPDADGEDFLPRAVRRLLAGAAVAGRTRGTCARPAAAYFRRGAPHRAVPRPAVHGGIRRARAHGGGPRDPGPGQSPAGAAGVGRRDSRSPGIPQQPLGLAEVPGAGTLGADRRQWLDHGGRGLGPHGRWPAQPHGAYDFAARSAAPAADGVSPGRATRRRWIAAGKCGRTRCAGSLRCPAIWRARSRTAAATGGKWSPSCAIWRRLCGGVYPRANAGASCGTCRRTGTPIATACRRNWPNALRP